MVCLGFEPGATGRYAQTKPRSYGGHTIQIFIGITYRTKLSLLSVKHNRSLVWQPRTEPLHQHSKLVPFYHRIFILLGFIKTK